MAMIQLLAENTTLTLIDVRRSPMTQWFNPRAWRNDHCPKSRISALIWQERLEGLSAAEVQESSQRTMFDPTPRKVVSVRELPPARPRKSESDDSSSSTPREPKTTKPEPFNLSVSNYTERDQQPKPKGKQDISPLDWVHSYK